MLRNLDTEPRDRSTNTEMYEVLDKSDENLITIRVHSGTRDGYQKLYELLVDKSDEYGSIHVYEETPHWSWKTFLTHLVGIVPDLRYGPKFNIDRYAAVGDSQWAKLLFDMWDAIRPIWPVAPEEMRYFDIEDREAALQWVRDGTETHPKESGKSDSPSNPE